MPKGLAPLTLTTMQTKASRSLLWVALMGAGCLPPAAPWPVVDDRSPSDADADVGGDEDADVDGGDDTGFVLECNSLYMGGGNSYVVVGKSTVDGAALYTDSSFTVELWAYIDRSVLSGRYTLVSLGDPEAWWLGLDDGDLIFESGLDDIARASLDDRVAVQLPEGETYWFHIGAVMDRSNNEMRVYLNGDRVVAMSPVGPLEQPTEQEVLRFGRSVDSLTSWPSSIDEVRFGHAVNLSGVDPDFSVERSTEGWIGVWRFNNDLVNEVTGQSAAGSESLTYYDSCP